MDLNMLLLLDTRIVLYEIHYIRDGCPLILDHVNEVRRCVAGSTSQHMIRGWISFAPKFEIRL